MPPERRRGLLRIDQMKEGETLVVRAEGRLAGPWVDELRRVFSQLWDRPQSNVALDLASVGYVHAIGERLLRDAIARGAHIRRRSSFVATLLDGRSGGGSR
jgi:hypothetical protein